MTMFTRGVFAISAVVLVLSLAAPRWAVAQTGVGTAFTFQGQLQNAGSPANGSFDLQFKLFDAATAGAQQGATLCADNVAISNGLFTVTLDFGPLFGTDARWLEVAARADTTAGNCATGVYTTLAPRQRLTPTPVAEYALGPWVPSGTNLSFTGGSVGIGTSTPSNRLTVSQEADTNCIVAIDSGLTASQSSVLRFNDQGTAFWSVSKNSGNDFTIREVGASADRLYISRGGFIGIGTSNPGYKLDVEGTAPSPSPLAYFSATNNGSIALRADQTGSNSGTGISALAEGTGGTGVQGDASAQTGNGTGVIGIGASSSGYGVFAYGRTGATGTKSFHIDHPLDPANKFLNHYCAEGPDPLNIYRGHATLDGAGEAWVQLPDYFDSINRDCEYQLTAIGAPAPGLYVADEVRGNRFRIAGGRPWIKVSWQVAAVRNDAWVRANGAPVEEDKTLEQRGKYASPELYGRPSTDGIVLRASAHAARAHGDDR